MQCAKTGDVAGLEAAVRSGAQVNRVVMFDRLLNDQSAMHLAASNNQVQAAIKLLSLGASLENPNRIRKLWVADFYVMWSIKIVYICLCHQKLVAYLVLK